MNYIFSFFSFVLGFIISGDASASEDVPEKLLSHDVADLVAQSIQNARRRTTDFSSLSDVEKINAIHLAFRNLVNRNSHLAMMGEADALEHIQNFVENAPSKKRVFLKRKD